ncbi:TRS120 [Candida metapsilosis]|uniref:TRS120 n=1 Tax=Candida metapsilosis TaxID=273372 RepID=A0A8H7ZIQ1_9ASCO|nr:TRS120 [Candida metapsilosis]
MKFSCLPKPSSSSSSKDPLREATTSKVQVHAQYMSTKYKFLTPATVRILLVPINHCSLRDYNRYINLIRSSIKDLRLLDLKANANLHFFNPATFPEGRIIPDFTTIDDDSIYLHEFEPFRKTFIVLGIGRYDKDSDHLTQLKKIYSGAIVHSTIQFDTPESELSKSTTNSYYHNGTASHFSALEGIFSEIFDSFLIALDEYASAYSNISLRSPVSITDSHVLTKTINQAQKRLSAGSTSFKASFNGLPTDTPNTPKTSTDKSKSHSKYSGRYHKLMGNLFLLTGKYNDALHSFTESITALRRFDDFLWLGSALEGLALSILLLSFVQANFQLNSMLGSWLSISKSSVSIDHSASKRSSVESNGSKANVLSPRTSLSATNAFSIPLTSTVDLNTLSVPETLKVLLAKAIYFYGQSTDDPENMVPDVVYIECILRKLSLMIGYHLSAPLEEIVQGRVTSDIVDNTYFSTQDILADVDRIFSLQLIDLNIIDQCHIYSYIAHVYHKLKFFRKEAFILRFHLIALVSQFKPSQDLKSIKELLDDIFDLYGIKGEPDISFMQSSPPKNVQLSLQLQVLKLALNSAEHINNKELTLNICCLSLARYSHCIPADGQIRLWNMIEKITSQSSLTVPHLDPFMVRKVKFVSTRQKDDLAPFVDVDVDSSQQSFFDPYHMKNDTINMDRILIKDEVHQLKITMHNPFAFEIEISDLEVVSEATKVETLKPMTQQVLPSAQSSPALNKLRSNPKRNATTSNIAQITAARTSIGSIPPMSNATILVSFKALSVGEMKITGLMVTISGCEKQYFPIADKFSSVEGFKTPIVADEVVHTKSSVFDTLYKYLRGELIDSRVSYRSLPLTVIRPQPVLKVVDLTIPNRCIMLLEGEEVRFKVTLMNDSNEVINYLSFSFWDSAIDYLDRKLSQPRLNAFEVYELEWSLLKFKSFRILNKDVIGEHIKPGEQVTIEYLLTSRKFMRQSKIVLDYANRSNDQSFIKHLDVPIAVSVVPSLEIVGCDIISSLSEAALKNADLPSTLSSVSSYLKTVDDVAQYCLLVLDLRNCWTSALHCDLQYDDFKLSDLIESNKTARYFIPLRKVRKVPKDSIPSLRKKQFIKDYDLTAEDEAQMIKSFWLKQIVSAKLTGRWWTDGRHGLLDVRSLRLTPKMANNLVVSQLEVETEIASEGGEFKPGQLYDLQVDQFYTLRTRITNHTDHEVSGFVRQLPLPASTSPSTNLSKSLSIDKKILINGVLQRKLPTIKPSDTSYIDTSFVIIEKGEYEWGTVVDLLTEHCVDTKPLHITAN